MLQIKPYLDESAEEISDFAEYRSKVTKYTRISKDINKCHILDEEMKLRIYNYNM